VIITLCASTKFYDHVNEIAPLLKTAGHHDLLPKTSMPNAEILEDDGSSKYKQWRKGLIDTHFRKVEKSDAILVVNDTKNSISGYIGANTLMEITIAYYLNKKVFILNEISSDNPVYDEILAIEAIVLSGDISKISLRDY